MILWLKALHIIAVIAWMAGLLYLPRLFVYHAGVYHAGAKPGSKQAATFALMERRLLKIIMTPAMLATLITGFLLFAFTPQHAGELWFLGKVLCVFGMVYCHIAFAGMRKEFERGENIRTPRYYKIWNEAPTVLMVAIVILVVVKPF